MIKKGGAVIVDKYDPNSEVMIEGTDSFSWTMGQFNLRCGYVTKVLAAPDGFDYILVDAGVMDDGLNNFLFRMLPNWLDKPRLELWCNRNLFKEGTKGDLFLYEINNGPINVEVIGEENE